MRLKNQIVVLSRRNRAFLMLFCIMLNFCVPLAVAGPEGAQVASGQVTFQQSGLNTTVTASDKAIVNYRSFDIAQPEVVRFVQPGSDASVLNRILSANPTNIDGTLLANGRVFFVNPAGVYIGEGAMINVNQLVASGLNISNSDFLNGRYNFIGGEGAVVNRGSILAKKAYLIGERITNSGNIRCPDGYVVMAAGERVFVGESGSNLMIETDAPATARTADPIEGSRILNEGSVEVGGGIMAFAAAGDIYSQAISNVGTLSASVDSGDAGNVKLSAPDGTVVNSGSITAKSRSGRGGSVQLLGDRVGLLGSAAIDASGATGGGTVLVGGDYKGAGSLPTASRTYVGRNATIKADATQNGDGGKVVVWSDQFTRFLGEICARAGAKGGNGGEVEVSGKEKLGFYGRVDTSAPRGTTGRLLLDPADIVIQGGDGSFSSLDEVDVFDDPGDELTVSEKAIEDADSDVTLQARNSITVSNEFAFNEGDVKLKQDNSLTMETRNAIGDSGLKSAGIDLTGAVVEFQTQGTGSIKLHTGVADENTGAGVKVGKMTNLGTGSIQIESEGGVEIKGPVTAGTDGYHVASRTGNITFKGGSITGAGPGTLIAAGGILNEGSSSGPTIKTTNGGDLYLGATNALDSTQAITITSGGSLELNAPLGATNSSAETTLRANGDLDISKSIKAQSIEAHSGTSGTGNLAFGPGVTLDAPNITLRAGNGPGGGTDAQVHLSTPPVISPDTYDPFTFKLEQDAGFTDELVKAIFGDKSSQVELTVTSYDSNLRFTTGGKWKSITAGGHTGIDIWADLQAIEAMTFNDDVTLGADTTLTGTTVKFAKKVDGAGKSLTVNASGVTRFGGPVGSGGALGSVETDEPGSTAIDGGSVSATTQTYRDDVTLGKDTELNGSDVTFGKKVNGVDKSLTVNASGATKFEGPVGSAGALLKKVETDAAGSTAINGGSVWAGTQTYRDDVTLGKDTTLTGSDLTFEKSVVGVKGMILNATGKLLAKGILWAKGGDVELLASDDAGDTGTGRINLEDNVTASQDILLKNNTKVSDAKKLQAGRDVVLTDGKTLRGLGALTLEATGGQIRTDRVDGKVKIHMAADDKTLRLTQKERLLLTTGFEVTDYEDPTPKDTHLVGEVTGGSLEDSTADQWKSITATAKNDVKLSGSGTIRAGGLLKSDSGGVAVTSSGGALSLLDVTAENNVELNATSGNVVLGGDVVSSGGGVSIISANGGIYDATKTGLGNDEIKIQGYSDQSKGVGVGLPNDENQKAAIVIQSSKDLKLGEKLTLTANGVYDPINHTRGTGSVDDRGAVKFKLDGDPIDVAIYIASTGPGSAGSAGVEVGSGHITIENTPGNGALVAYSKKSAESARDAVTFRPAFEDSLKSTGSTIKYLEVASEHTPTLDWADYYDTLPHAGNAAAFAGGKFDYGLRGPEQPGAELRLLERSGPAPLAPPPIPFEPNRADVVLPVLDPNVEREVKQAFGEGFLRVRLAGADPCIGTEVDKETMKSIALRIQEYWRVLKNPDVSAPAVAFLNDQVKTKGLPEAILELQKFAAFEQVPDSKKLAAKWAKAAVGFWEVSVCELGKHPDEVQTGYLEQFLADATEKLQGEIMDYLITEVESCAASWAQDTVTERADQAMAYGSTVPTGKEMLEYWKVIEENSSEVISILNKEVENLPDATQDNLTQFKQVLLKDQVVSQWSGAMLDFMEGADKAGSLTGTLVAEILLRVLPQSKVGDKVHIYMARYLAEQLSSRGISLD